MCPCDRGLLFTLFPEEETELTAQGHAAKEGKPLGYGPSA